MSALAVEQSRLCSHDGCRCFSTSGKDQKDDKSASGTKKQESATVGTDGGMLVWFFASLNDLTSDIQLITLHPLLTHAHHA